MLYRVLAGQVWDVIVGETDDDDGGPDVEAASASLTSPIENLHRAVGGDIDIGRLQIPMNDPVLVRGLEWLPREWQRLAHLCRLQRTMRHSESFEGGASL